MKSNASLIRLTSLAAAIVLLGAVPPATAQYTAAPTVANLPYGVDDVLKLSRSGINEDIILNYIKTSGTVYDLRPADIVYLRDQGVSDRVMNAMLDQRKPIQTTPATPEATTAQPQPGAQITINTQGPQCPTQCDSCGGSLLTYYPTAPLSTVHVIPYPAARRAYYSSYSLWNGPYRPYSSWYPYRYYNSFGVGCGWWQPRCGHWHGCAHWPYR